VYIETQISRLNLLHVPILHRQWLPNNEWS